MKSEYPVNVFAVAAPKVAGLFFPLLSTIIKALQHSWVAGCPSQIELIKLLLSLRCLSSQGESTEKKEAGRKRRPTRKVPEHA